MRLASGGAEGARVISTMFLIAERHYGRAAQSLTARARDSS